MHNADCSGVRGTIKATHGPPRHADNAASAAGRTGGMAPARQLRRSVRAVAVGPADGAPDGPGRCPLYCSSAEPRCRAGLAPVMATIDPALIQIEFSPHSPQGNGRKPGAAAAATATARRGDRTAGRLAGRRAALCALCRPGRCSSAGNCPQQTPETRHGENFALVFKEFCKQNIVQEKCDNTKKNPRKKCGMIISFGPQDLALDF